MYIVTEYFQKPEAKVNFFLESSEKNRALNQSYLELESAAPGFIKRQVRSCPDVNSYTVVTYWRHFVDYHNYLHANEKFLKDFFTQRQAYYDSQKILYDVFYDRM